jgi:nucleoside-diphosphate-sugar epimerase
MATTALNTPSPHSVAPQQRIAHRLKGRPRQLSRFVNNAARDGESVRGDEKGKLLVLGGTGFIGSKICERALSSGYDVVSISRRGDPPGDPHRYPSDIMKRVDWRKGDCTREDTIAAVLQEGGFVGCIHAVGMLLASDINALASGSGSKPTPGATYDDVTRITAFNAANAAADLCVAKNENDAVPFVFVSAAEARWDFKAPVAWLEEYLVAKRAVEARLSEMTEAGAIRGSCLRPSLVYSPDKPAAMPAVGAFYVGNAIGLPFVDRPVTVDTLASAAVRCVEDGRSSGALDYRDMERLSAELRRD